jgi:hypothetical protein
MSNLKVEGKVSDWCSKCKNCKSATRNYLKEFTYEYEED